MALLLSIAACGSSNQDSLVGQNINMNAVAGSNATGTDTVTSSNSAGAPSSSPQQAAAEAAPHLTGNGASSDSRHVRNMNDAADSDTGDDSTVNESASTSNEAASNLE